MTNRERFLAVLNYQEYDRLPVISFNFWKETVQAWYAQGRLTAEEGELLHDDCVTAHRLVSRRLGFDFDWDTHFYAAALDPPFERTVVKTLPGGGRHVINQYGAVELEIDGAYSIPQEVDYTLKDRGSWEEIYRRRLIFSPKRVEGALQAYRNRAAFDQPVIIYCGSLYGEIRNWLGLQGISYLYYDDEALFDEVVQTVCDLRYRMLEGALNTGIRFDLAHFWEDICCKNGPLIAPSVFEEKIAHLYGRFTRLLKQHGIELISLDCDGCIDKLIPGWLDHGINIMTPIEVGTWNASIEPWRAQYGKGIRGIGGMDKRVFSQDYTAIDKEIERLKPLVSLGGYLPMPDHMIPPDAKWENVQYYCEMMRKAFG